jgi:hypothetical protein
MFSQFSLEVTKTSLDVGLDRRDPHPGQLGDLAQRPAVGMHQHHRDPLTLREALQRTRKLGLNGRLSIVSPLKQRPHLT